MQIRKPLLFQASPINSCLNRALDNLHRVNRHVYTNIGSLIQHCSNQKLVAQGKQIHAQITLFGINPDNYLATKLLAFYSKCGSISEARKVFDRITDRNIFAWNAMLIAYSAHHRHFQTLQLFSDLIGSGLQPDNFTITCLLKALSSQFYNLDFAAEIQGFIIRHRLDSDIFVSNALLTMYSRSGDLSSARKLFHGMPERDVVSWNSMISAYSHSGFCEESLRLYREMMGSVKPNEVTIACVLQACSQLQDLVFGMEVHQFIWQDSGIKVDTVVYNSLIGLYSKCGALTYARGLFDEMPERDEVSWGAMITGYMLQGSSGEAMELFRKMKNPVLSTWNAVISGLLQNNLHGQVLKLFQEMQVAGCKPNATTISTILSTFCYLSSLPSTKQIHSFAIRNNHNSNVYVSSALIDTYSKSGSLPYARRVFAGMAAQKSVVVWTAIIAAHAVHGQAYAALDLFSKMQAAGIRPDSVTFTAVLSACAHGGAVDEAWRVFDIMWPVFNITPAVEHYACMVGALGRTGLLVEAVEFIKKMPVEPNAKVWGNLLGAASIFCDAEIGQFAADRLFEIEPENSGNYVALANIYSRAKEWENAENLRKMMRERGLKKNPGCSWIETAMGLQSFISGDASNARSEEIDEILESLVWLMKEEGYAFEEELDEESIFD